MMLTRLRIHHFGKLKDVELPLSSKINVIYGANEAGKTTMQSFIKAMLYGMNSSKKDIRENDRLRFLPWGGGVAAGELHVISKEGHPWIIKRSFDGKKRKDEETILHGITGEEIDQIDRKKPGQDLLGIGEDAFDKTIFIKQLSLKVERDKEDEIMKRLINLQETGDEDASYHGAAEALKEARKRLVGQRKPGKIDELKARRRELVEEKDRIEGLCDEGKEMQIEYGKLLEQRREVEESWGELEAAKEECRKRKRKQTYEILKGYETKIQGLRAVWTEKEKCLEKGKIKIDEAFVQGLRQRHLQRLRLKREIKEMEILHQKAEVEGLKSKLKEEQAKDQWATKKGQLKGLYHRYKMGEAWGAVLFAVGSLAAWRIHGYFIGLGAVGVMLILYSFFKKSKLSHEIQKIDHELSQYEDKNGYPQQTHIDQDEEYRIKSQLELLEKNMMDMLMDAGIYDDSLDKLDEILSGWASDIAAKTNLENHIKSLEEAYTALKNNGDLEGLDKEPGDYGYGHIHRAMDEETIEQKIKEHHQSLIALEGRIKEAEHKIKDSFIQTKTRIQIEEEIIAISDEIASYEETASALELSLEVLEESFREIQRDFGPRLNRSAGRVLETITGGKYAELRISDSYGIKVTDLSQNQIKDLGYFSNGTWDQIYFALRIGIADLILSGEDKIPLILDDAFTQYDDERLEAVLDYLYSNTNQYQILLFTCQKREMEILKRYSDINLIHL